MRNRTGLSKYLVMLAIFSAAGLLLESSRGAAAQQTDPSAITVTVTITAKGNGAPPAIPKDDVVARQGGKVRRVLAWEPAQPGGRGMDLVILIDDELPFHVATRWDDFENFVTALPANVHVGVAYANKGAVNFTQQPTLNHAAAAKAFREPLNIDLHSDAIYQSLQHLAAEWPANQNRHEILLLSSGYDYDGASGGGRPDDSIPLQGAVNDLQGKGITVFSFYANPSSTPQNVTVYMAQWGQGALEHVSTVTGGKAFIFGDGTPPTFQPFLQELAQILGQQYSLTFQAERGSKGAFASFEVKVEENNVQVHAPARVFVPGMK
ncbi:MAG TPA: hypothetical protein VGZ48_02855 [Candidatus Acidoferrales bacterium]|jgi:hypothetical protein|nr:hypothetical protein [Candidatus Acidoferrales bacterium]